MSPSKTVEECAFPLGRSILFRLFFVALFTLIKHDVKTLDTLDTSASQSPSPLDTGASHESLMLGLVAAAVKFLDNSAIFQPAIFQPTSQF
jgi:hypothetical protein